MAEFARGGPGKTAKETGETFAMNSIHYNEPLKSKLRRLHGFCSHREYHGNIRTVSGVFKAIDLI
jgi:hypothetical protein